MSQTLVAFPTASQRPTRSANEPRITTPPRFPRTRPHAKRQATVLDYSAVAGFITGDGIQAVGCPTQSAFFFDHSLSIAGCCLTVNGGGCELPTTCEYRSSFYAGAAEADTRVTTCTGDRPQCAINFFTDIGYSDVYCASANHPSAVLLARIPTKNVGDISTELLAVLNDVSSTATDSLGDFGVKSVASDASLTLTALQSSSDDVCATTGSGDSNAQNQYTYTAYDANAAAVTTVTVSCIGAGPSASLSSTNVSSSATPTNTSASNGGSSHSLTTGQILGIALGSLVAVWLFFLVGAILCWRRRRRDRPTPRGTTMMEVENRAAPQPTPGDRELTAVPSDQQLVPSNRGPEVQVANPDAARRAPGAGNGRYGSTMVDGNARAHLGNSYTFNNHHYYDNRGPSGMALHDVN